MPTSNFNPNTSANSHASPWLVPLALTITAAVPTLFYLSSSISPQFKFKELFITPSSAYPDRRKRTDEAIQTVSKARMASASSPSSTTSLQKHFDSVFVTHENHVTSLSLSSDFILTVTLTSGSSASTTPLASSPASFSFSAPLLTGVCPILDKIASNIIRSNTYTFTADATGGSSSSLLQMIFAPPTPNVTPPNSLQSQVVLVETAPFLPSLAICAARSTLSDSSLKACLTSLFLLAENLGTSTSPTPKRVKTIVFNLTPELSSIAPLLRHVFEAFPHDRHLFAYDGLRAVVVRARASLKRLLPSGDARSLNYTPLISMEYITGLTKALESVKSYEDASTVEAWVAAVDSMIKLKSKDEDEALRKEQEHEKYLITGVKPVKVKKTKAGEKEIYLPFVMRLDYLYDEDDEMKGELGLVNVIQFVTGSRSRVMTTYDMNRAVGLWQEWKEEMKIQTTVRVKLDASEISKIENCVFQHKSIFIGDKTLEDTVQPQALWSLKAARKASGCACCAPDSSDSEDEDDDDSDNEEDGGIERGGGRGGSSSKNGWRDGKAGFAFDPSIFKKK